ncbi:MAG: AMP-binding protein [Oscillospiraceae bacterium]|nr:AMP-binding protein [Oscillospiraceae bacterium]
MNSKSEILSDYITEELEKCSPDKIIFRYIRESGSQIDISCGEIIKMMDSAADCLVSCGLKRGDRVVMTSPTQPYYMIAILAAIKAGIVPVLLDTSMEQTTFNQVLDLVEAKGVMTIPALINKIPDSFIKTVPVFDISEGISFAHGSIHSVDDSLEPTTAVDPDDEIIIFSSGTTSNIKGVGISHKANYLFTHDVPHLYDCHDYDSSFLAILPLSHVAGFISAFSFLFQKNEIFMIENCTASKMPAAIHHFNPDVILGVPKILEAFMNKIEQELSKKPLIISATIHKLMRLSLSVRKEHDINIGAKIFRPLLNKAFGKNARVIASGGAALKQEVIEYFAALGLTVVNVYAATETSPNFVITNIHDYKTKCTGMIAQDYIDVQILNPDSEGIGEIAVKSPGVMKGYFKDPETTRAAFNEKGYFLTGDYGRMEGRYITVTGRKKEAIALSNGEKVSPDMVESSYLSVMGPVPYAVCGVQFPENESFDTICLFAEGSFTQDDRKKITDDVLAKASQLHDNYKVKKVFFIEKIPRTSIGKCKRFELKDIALNMSVPDSSQSRSEKMKTRKTGKNETVYSWLCGQLTSICDNKCEITQDSTLNSDLALSSLDMLDLCVAAETRYHVNMQQTLDNDITVGKLAAFIEENKSEGRRKNLSATDKTYPKKKTRLSMMGLSVIQFLSRCLWKFNVDGLENIPENGSVLICPNHQTYLDAMWVSSFLSHQQKKSLKCMAAHEFLDKWYTRGVFSMLGGIPVDRSGNASSAMHRCIECLENEDSVVIIHPEGTRTRTTKIGEFKQGAAAIAMKSNTVIVPALIEGGCEVYPVGRKLPRILNPGHFSRRKINIHFGKPISPDEETPEVLTQRLKKEVINLKNQAS